MRGQSRLLRVSELGCSGALSAAICPIPKLIVRVRFPSPAPGKPRSRHGRESLAVGTHGHSPGARVIGRSTDRKRPPKLFKLIVDSFEVGSRRRRSGQAACCPSHQAGRRASRPRGVLATPSARGRSPVSNRGYARSRTEVGDDRAGSTKAGLSGAEPGAKQGRRSRCCTPLASRRGRSHG